MLTSFLLAGLIQASAHAHSVTGRLYVVKGRARVIGASDQASQVVQIFRSNDRIEVSNHSVATVWVLATGARYQLASPSVVRIANGVPVALKGAAPKALPKLGSAVTAVFQNSEPQAAIQVRSGDNVRITPTGGVLKAPDRISWDRLSQAVSYDFSIADEGTQGGAPAFHVEGVSANSVPVPTGLLIPGNIYRLTLAANTSNGGCVMSYRTLRLISRSQMAAIREAERELDADTPSSEMQLAKADLFEEYGLYGESLGCLAELKQPTAEQEQQIAKLKSLAEGRS